MRCFLNSRSSVIAVHFRKFALNVSNLSSVFRIMISTKSVRCFVIQDPVGMYKSEKLNMTVRDGANLSYGQDAGFWEELLV